MEKTECLYKLKTQYFKDTNQKSNISKLTTSARGDDKTECINTIWWVSQVRLALSSMEKWESDKEEHNSAWNISPCQQKMINTYIKNFAQKSNPSKLASDAWWNDKQVCLNEIGWYNQLNKFLNNIENSYEEQYDTDLLYTGNTPIPRYEQSVAKKTQETENEFYSAPTEELTTSTGSNTEINQDDFADLKLLWNWILYIFISLIAI
jgi:hypothetical protein